MSNSIRTNSGRAIYPGRGRGVGRARGGRTPAPTPPTPRTPSPPLKGEIVKLLKETNRQQFERDHLVTDDVVRALKKLPLSELHQKGWISHKKLTTFLIKVPVHEAFNSDVPWGELKLHVDVRNVWGKQIGKKARSVGDLTNQEIAMLFVIDRGRINQLIMQENQCWEALPTELPSWAKNLKEDQLAPFYWAAIDYVNKHETEGALDKLKALGIPETEILERLPLGRLIEIYEPGELEQAVQVNQHKLDRTPYDARLTALKDLTGCQPARGLPIVAEYQMVDGLLAGIARDHLAKIAPATTSPDKSLFEGPPENAKDHFTYLCSQYAHLKQLGPVPEQITEVYEARMTEVLQALWRGKSVAKTPVSIETNPIRNNSSALFTKLSCLPKAGLNHPYLSADALRDLSYNPPSSALERHFYDQWVRATIDSVDAHLEATPPANPRLLAHKHELFTVLFQAAVPMVFLDSAEVIEQNQSNLVKAIAEVVNNPAMLEARLSELQEMGDLLNYVPNYHIPSDFDWNSFFDPRSWTTYEHHEQLLPFQMTRQAQPIGW